MSPMGLSNGSKVKDLDEAALRLKKGGKVCVVEIEGVLKSYPLSREGHYRQTLGDDKVHIVEGRA